MVLSADPTSTRRGRWRAPRRRRSLSGELYRASDPELVRDRLRGAGRCCDRSIPQPEEEQRLARPRGILGWDRRGDVGCSPRSPATTAHNVQVGDHVFINFNAVISGLRPGDDRRRYADRVRRAARSRPTTREIPTSSARSPGARPSVSIGFERLDRRSGDRGCRGSPWAMTPSSAPAAWSRATSPPQRGGDGRALPRRTEALSRLRAGRPRLRTD